MLWFAEASVGTQAVPQDQSSSPPAEAAVDVVTYDDAAADHVAPLSAESAQAAFEQAGQNSFVRREDAVHPGMHIAAAGESQHRSGRHESWVAPSSFSKNAICCGHCLSYACLEVACCLLDRTPNQHNVKCSDTYLNN